MTSASSLAFPGSRTLATWWRQLAAREPTLLCVGYLFLHRLEAPACWLEPQPLDPLHLHVLEALSLVQSGTATHEHFYPRLQQLLNLDVGILRRLVRSLGAWNLVDAAARLVGAESWVLTEQGRTALRTKQYWARRWKRANFPFVERLDPSGQRVAPPHFAGFRDAPASPWHAEEAAAFQVSWLHACLAQDAVWKKTFGFPLELVAFPDAAPPAGEIVSPDHVVVDRAERMLIVLCQGSKPGNDLLGFAVRPEGWVLNAAEPIVNLPPAAAAILPELERPASREAWQQSWQTWCSSRTVPAADAQECSLTCAQDRLLVQAPERLVQYLQAGKSDIFKGETWLLAGDGYLRQAARVELTTR
jgi:hypothetical protein